MKHAGVAGDRWPVAGGRWIVPTGQGGLEWRVGPKIKVQDTHRTTVLVHSTAQPPLVPQSNPSTSRLDEWKGHGKDMERKRTV